MSEPTVLLARGAFRPAMSPESSPSRKRRLSEDGSNLSNVDGPSRGGFAVERAEQSRMLSEMSSTRGSMHDLPNERSSSPTPSNSGSAKGSVDHTGGLTKSTGLPKRRKITPAEREEKRKEKERKEQLKAEQRAQRDEEKRLKEEEKRKRDEQRDEEKRKKEEEREEKRRAKEFENSKKELERKKKEEEKQKIEDERGKKERLRLNSFFTKPPTHKNERTEEEPRPAPTSGIDSEVSISTVGDAPALVAGTNTTPSSPHKTVSNDFEQHFPPFFVQSCVTLAPLNRFNRHKRRIDRAGEHLDPYLRNALGHTVAESIRKTAGSCGLSHVFTTKRRKINKGGYLSTRDIVARIQGSASNPIDLTQPDFEAPEALLAALPVKHLQFAEDVRPPYRGTFARNDSKKKPGCLRRAPFKRALPDINYDYDSEAEWEEPDPDDGEDLGSEGEEERSDDDGEEMKDFLDDEDLGDGLTAPTAKRRAIVGDLEPVCSDLVWENAYGKTPSVVPETEKFGLESFRMEVIHDAMHGPIDPFSDIYWKKTSQSSALDPERESKGSNGNGSNNMSPPRVPLHAINRSNAAINNQLQIIDSSGKIVKPQKGSKGEGVLPKSVKVLTDSSDLTDFKKAIEGSDLTKTGLIEVLKKQFPKTPKDVIKNTLEVTAARVGVKEAEKRWALLEGV